MKNKLKRRHFETALSNNFFKQGSGFSRVHELGDLQEVEQLGVVRLHRPVHLALLDDLLRLLLEVVAAFGQVRELRDLAWGDFWGLKTGTHDSRPRWCAYSNGGR
jgi:hypothetical protein